MTTTSFSEPTVTDVLTRLEEVVVRHFVDEHGMTYSEAEQWYYEVLYDLDLAREGIKHYHYLLALGKAQGVPDVAAF